MQYNGLKFLIFGRVLGSMSDKNSLRNKKIHDRETKPEFCKPQVNLKLIVGRGKGHGKFMD